MTTPKGLVILGTRGPRQTMRTRVRASTGDFVGVGSYVVMEHTVLNGFPVGRRASGPGRTKPFAAS